MLHLESYITEQPSQATANPASGKSMLNLLPFIPMLQHLLSSQITQFEICISIYSTTLHTFIKFDLDMFSHSVA